MGKAEKEIIRNKNVLKLLRYDVIFAKNEIGSGKTDVISFRNDIVQPEKGLIWLEKGGLLT